MPIGIPAEAGGADRLDIIRKIIVRSYGGSFTIGDTNADIAYSPDLEQFVTVGVAGLITQRVNTSPDGERWTSVTAASTNDWRAVVWSSDLSLWCAVSSTGVGNRVMTSTDGVTWTSRVSAADEEWYSICWSGSVGLFVATAINGVADTVMTSPDGINWTARAVPALALGEAWYRVIWAEELGLFVAGAGSGGNNRIMTSPDGINWTLQTIPNAIRIRGLAWSPLLGILVAVADSGATGTRIIYSSDAVTWNNAVAPAGVSSNWKDIAWSDELQCFFVVRSGGAITSHLFSTDGINFIEENAGTTLSDRVIYSPKHSRFVGVWSNVARLSL